MFQLKLLVISWSPNTFKVTICPELNYHSIWSLCWTSFSYWATDTATDWSKKDIWLHCMYHACESCKFHLSIANGFFTCTLSSKQWPFGLVKMLYLSTSVHHLWNLKRVFVLPKEQIFNDTKGMCMHISQIKAMNTQVSLSSEVR